MTKSEKVSSTFSAQYFFDEMVQDDLSFINQAGNEVQLSDLVLNMDDTVAVIEIKERNESKKASRNTEELNWLIGRAKEAKKQLKKSINYIKSGALPAFPNKRGIKKVIRPDAEIVPLVLFMNDALTKYPRILKKHSETGLTINCISLEDFQTMFAELIAPKEVIKYLNYRRDYYDKNGELNLVVYSSSDTSALILPQSEEKTLIQKYLVEHYGKNELQNSKDFYDTFRWYVQHTLDQSTAHRDSDVIQSIFQLLIRFSRPEMKAYLQRLILARNKSFAFCQEKVEDCKIVGSMRLDDYYVIQFVASTRKQGYSMEKLLSIAREHCNPHKLMQVYTWWEDNLHFRIEYEFWHNAKEEGL